MSRSKKKNLLMERIVNLDEVGADEVKGKRLEGVFRMASRIKAGKKRFEELITNIFYTLTHISDLVLNLQEGEEKLRGLSDNIISVMNKVKSASEGTTRVILEVSKAQESLSESIQQVSINTDNILSETENNENELEHIKTLAETTKGQSNEMMDDMGELLNTISEIQNVIAAINGISEQTNLLALNASIEAARAGESGRGFAVVADEIRKLAEETKNLTANMGNFVNNIRMASDKSSNSAKETVESLGEISEGLDKVWKSSQNNKRKVAEINETMTNIAALSQENNASVDEVEIQIKKLDDGIQEADVSVSEINNVSDGLREVILPINEIENGLDACTKVIGDMATDRFYMFDNSIFTDYMDQVMQAHKNMMGKLEFILANKSVAPIQTDPKKCAFGHVYYSIRPKNGDLVSIWDDVEGVHNAFHEQAHELVLAVDRENDEEAKEILNKCKNSSEELTASFQKLIRITEDLSEGGKSIFEE